MSRVLIKVSEAAALLACSTSLIYELCQLRSIPFVRLPSRGHGKRGALRFDEAQLLVWIKDHRVAVVGNEAVTPIKAVGQKRK